MLPLLGIFGRAHTDPLGQRFHVHLAQVLVAAWQSDHQSRRHSREEKEDDKVELRYEPRGELAKALPQLAACVSQWHCPCHHRSAVCCRA